MFRFPVETGNKIAVRPRPIVGIGSHKLSVGWSPTKIAEWVGSAISLSAMLAHINPFGPDQLGEALWCDPHRAVG